MDSRAALLVANVTLLLLLLASATNGAEPFHMEEYLKFPPVFLYDDFEDCRRYYTDYVYCVVKAPLEPDESSALWRNISDFSSDYHHYDHQVLERGVCLQKCQDALIQNGTQSIDSYTQTDLIHQCVSNELTTRYQLRLQPELHIQYCYSKSTESLPYDWLDAVFLLLAGTIIFLVVASTVYDLHEQAKQRFPESYFGRNPKLGHQRVLTAFSFPRNLRRLKDPQTTQTRIDLACFESFRCVQTLRVVFLHVSIAHMKLPQRNPEFFEQLQQGAALKTFIAEFQNYVQTFFAIGGMLMAINFLDHIRKHPNFRLAFFGERLLNRLCRLVPTYAFMILLESSVMRHMIDGPFGKQFIGESSESCHRWWWANLLFINNYIGWGEPCFIPSWYLATDLQLYIFGLAIMMVFWKWPSTRKYIFGGIFVYSVVVPAIVYLTSDITPVMTIDMKDTEKYIRGQLFQSVLYFPFHQNTGVYFCGMLGGMVYHHYRDQRKELFKHGVFRQVAQLSGMLYVFSMVTVAWVVTNLSWLPAACLAVYASTFKISWGLFNTVLLVVLALLHRHNWIKMALSHPIFGVLGKLGYSVYLIHFTVIVQVYGREKAPIFSNELIVTGYTAEVLFFSYILGLVLCLMVELPTGAVLKELLETPSSSSSNKPSSSNAINSKVHTVTESSIGGPVTAPTGDVTSNAVNQGSVPNAAH